MWTSHPNYRELVATSWGLQAQGYAIMRLVHKLSRLRGNLRRFNREVYDDVVLAFQAAGQRVSDIQSKLQVNPHDYNLLSQ